MGAVIDTVGGVVSGGVVFVTVTETGTDGIPFATTTNVLTPGSMLTGISKFVDTGALPVATAMVL